MYSISTNFYPENKDAMVGYIEAVTGIGLILGPLIGSFLYSLGGYRFIFFSFGSLFVFLSFFVNAIFPASVDKTTSSEQSSREDAYQRPQSDDVGDAYVNADREINIEDRDPGADAGGIDRKMYKIGTFELLKHPRYFFAATTGALGYFLYDFMPPILAFRLKDFNLTQVEIGLFFIVMPIFYIPISIMVQKVPNGVEKRAIMIIACFLSFFGNLCVGPSKIFNFPDTIFMMVIG